MLTNISSQKGHKFTLLLLGIKMIRFLNVYLDATPRTCIETQRHGVAADILNRKVITFTLQHFYPVKKNSQYDRMGFKTDLDIG
jgi:hypothetical protein